MTAERFYNIFNRNTGKKYNKVPVTYDRAREIKQMLTQKHGFGFFDNPIIIQGIYPATPEGWEEFLDDNGYEEFGQDYDMFIFAMNNDEMYCN